MLLAFVTLVGLASPALAHTRLDASVPSDGEVLDRPFDEVELTFSKPIELLPNSVRVFDDGGRRVFVDVATTRSEDGLVVTGAFGTPLYAGAWEVRWRILASDSHPREGVLAIVVAETVTAPPEPSASVDGPDVPSSAAPGAPAAQATPVVTMEPPVSGPSPFAFEIGGDVARAIYYVGLMIAVGLAFFKAGPHRGEQANATGLARASSLGAAIGLVGGTLEVFLHAGALSGTGWGGMFDGPTWSAIGRTGLGTALALRVVGLVALLVAGLRRARRGVPAGPDLVQLLGAALVIASFQFVGHTASTAPEWAIRIADVLHVVAAAVWVGGLVGLAMLSGHGDRLGRARTAARFSNAASVAVGLVALAGTALAFLNIPGPAQLFGTTYGRLLIAKLVLVGVLAALGAHNHFRVIPRLADGDTEALDDLRHTVEAEVLIVLIVLVLTALLINTTPI